MAPNVAGAGRQDPGPLGPLITGNDWLVSSLSEYQSPGIFLSIRPAGKWHGGGTSTCMSRAKQTP